MNTIQFNWCRVVGALIFAVVLIQICTMGFLTYVNTDPPAPQVHHASQVGVTERAEKVFEAMAARVEEENAVVDGSGRYRLYQNVWFGKKMNREFVFEDVGVVTHTTVNNMHHLIQSSKRWQGPMSVVVFAPGQDVIIALENILQLVWCVFPVRTYAIFHIVHPLDMPARDIKPYLPYEQLIDCRWMEKRMMTTFSIHNYGSGNVMYPNNILRNFGIEGSMTEYVYVLDVDLIPSVNLRQDFLEFARTNQLMFTASLKKPELIAFITPVFESTEDFLVPDNKIMLKRRFGKTLRQFYLEPCPQCQRVTDYDRWLNLTPDTVLKVAYSVEWSYPYEPFYIVHRLVPAYNPVFKQYGFNRISQLCELHVAGYQFKVLNNAFVVHVGYKYKDDFHATKEEEMTRNKALFYRHREELKSRYPNATRTCDVH